MSVDQLFLVYPCLISKHANMNPTVSYCITYDTCTVHICLSNGLEIITSYTTKVIENWWVSSYRYYFCDKTLLATVFALARQ